MIQGDERLDGWKAIGAHLGRDRSTAMRWARDRGLPIHSTPGGKTRSVFAYRSELAAWKRRLEDAEREPAPPPPLPEPPSPAPAPRSGAYRLPIAFAGAAAVGLIVAARLVLSPGGFSRTMAPTMPSDPQAAALFAQARSDWAQGTGAGRARAAGAFQRLTRLAPGFAPGFASLAEADLQTGEEGKMAEGSTAEARRAATRALELDARSAAANRALGFLAYWWDHDRARAARDFQRAVALDPHDPQTRLWYGDALLDNGESAAALREYDAVRLSEPDSPAVRAERAWALWAAGDDAAAEREIRATIAQAPQSEEAHDELGALSLTRGDLAAYVREERICAQLSGDQAYAAWLDALARTLAAQGPSAAMEAILHRALAGQITTMGLPNDTWAAYVASLAGRRQVLVEVLRRAEAAHEVWGYVGFQRRIAQRWRGDPEIIARLARLAPPPMEGAA